MEGYAIFDRTGGVIYQRKEVVANPRFFSLGECYQEFMHGEWKRCGMIGIVNLDTGRVIIRRGH